MDSYYFHSDSIYGDESLYVLPNRNARSNTSIVEKLWMKNLWRFLIRI
jgi:hypothetical protein